MPVAWAKDVLLDFERRSGIQPQVVDPEGQLGLSVLVQLRLSPPFDLLRNGDVVNSEYSAF